MQAITTIGLDIAKSVFQVHGIDAGCVYREPHPVCRRSNPAILVVKAAENQV